jgi:transcriptional regulator with XRE-family HTH domain
VPSRERAVDRGDRLARSDLARLGAELRLARVGAGLSLSQVGRSVGLSGSQVSRIERALAGAATVRQLARVGAVVGLDIRIRGYPGPDPLRDAAQIRLLDRIRYRLDARLTFRTEVPLPGTGDRRAWDGWIDGFQETSEHIGLPVEAETRIIDLQASTRRLALKMRDGSIECVLLIVADTRSNRAAIHAAGIAVSELFPVTPRSAWAALAAGRHPGGSALLLA